MNLLTLLFDRFTILLTAVLPAQGAFAALFDGLTHAGIALLFFLHGARLSRRAIIDGADAEPAAQAHPGGGGRGMSPSLPAERAIRPSLAGASALTCWSPTLPAGAWPARLTVE